MVHRQQQDVPLRPSFSSVVRSSGPATRSNGWKASSPREGRGLRGFEIDHRQRQRSGRRDRLVGLAAMARERRAQRLVPPHHLAEGLTQHVHVERPGELDGRRDVVSRAAGVQLIQEPEPLLGEREGERTGARRQARCAPPPLRRRRALPRHSRRARRSSAARTAAAAAARPRAPPAPARPAGWPAANGRRGRRSCRSRPPAGRRSRSRSPPAPPRRSRAARGLPLRCSPALQRQRGQRPAVDLAVGGQRQLGQRHEHRGDHVVRQARPSGTPAARSPAAPLRLAT